MPSLESAAGAHAERVFIGLGANLGDAAQTLREAVGAIGRLAGTQVLNQSPTYLSAPVDAQGPDFTNAVVEVRTTLSPLDLLAALQAIETEHGRQRPYRNAPRTLDLDLLLFGDRSIQSATLTVPHPRLHQRAFVLLPLLDLAPALSHPALGALSSHLGAVADQAIRRSGSVC